MKICTCLVCASYTLLTDGRSPLFFPFRLKQEAVAAVQLGWDDRALPIFQHSAAYDFGEVPGDLLESPKPILQGDYVLIARPDGLFVWNWRENTHGCFLSAAGALTHWCARVLLRLIMPFVHA